MIPALTVDRQMIENADQALASLSQQMADLIDQIATHEQEITLLHSQREDLPGPVIEVQAALKKAQADLRSAQITDGLTIEGTAAALTTKQAIQNTLDRIATLQRDLATAEEKQRAQEQDIDTQVQAKQQDINQKGEARTQLEEMHLHLQGERAQLFAQLGEQTYSELVPPIGELRNQEAQLLAALAENRKQQVAQRRAINTGLADWYELHTRVYDEYRIETFPLTTDDETLRILRGWLAWLDILDKDRHAFASSVVYRTNWQDLYQAIALSRWDIDRIVQEAGRRNNGGLLLEDKRSLVQELILRYESQRKDV